MFDSISTSSPTGLIIIAAVVLIGFIVVFLSAREIMVWYWKINKIIEFQTQIRDYLKTISLLLPRSSDISAPENNKNNPK